MAKETWKPLHTTTNGLLSKLKIVSYRSQRTTMGYTRECDSDFIRTNALEDAIQMKLFFKWLILMPHPYQYCSLSRMELMAFLVFNLNFTVMKLETCSRLASQGNHCTITEVYDIVL